MTATLRPMLSAKVDDVNALVFPVLASPKIDGVRALVRNGVLLSRNLKPIPNAYCQQLFGVPQLEGCDGELIVGEAADKGVFDRTQSGVMSRDGKPDVAFYIFDKWNMPGVSFPQRHAELLRQHHGWPLEAAMVSQTKLLNPGEVDSYEARMLAKGYEGVMLRRLSSKDTPYKFGRSTLREGLLMKLIRRSTMEGVVVGTVEQLHNANEQTRDERGYAKRTKHKANMVPTNKLGALVLTADRDTKAPIITTFEVGTGFTEQQRIALWRDRKSLKGKLVTVEYRELTKDGVPRFPVFKGFRHPNDIST